jgi:hypothetical protein
MLTAESAFIVRTIARRSSVVAIRRLRASSV